MDRWTDDREASPRTTRDKGAAGTLKKMVADLTVFIKGKCLEEQRQVFELDVVF